ncbi:hypothetical protein [Ochrobactrum sp. BTU1]|uniref:hypothetical protein n=1 Tax=Ochrobactrum sp. BTU1 TaxID=2840456 RepID=UPI001C0451D4|nr:hypothetical protein KMS41_14110 [Ochrobactrum sp. BTU1]
MTEQYEAIIDHLIATNEDGERGAIRSLLSIHEVLVKDVANKVDNTQAELFTLTLLVRDGIQNGFNTKALELACGRAEDALSAMSEQQ